MNALLFLVGMIVVFLSGSAVIAVYAVSQYDSDGFTIFPTKSSDYMSGYRAGVIQAYKDVQLLNADKIPGIDAHQDKIKCPANIIGDSCLGYKDGYSDEAMDQLE
jgi:hypothetical protein